MTLKPETFFQILAQSPNGLSKANIPTVCLTQASSLVQQGLASWEGTDPTQRLVPSDTFVGMYGVFEVSTVD